jgi:hypothetical protein
VAKRQTSYPVISNLNDFHSNRNLCGFGAIFIVWQEGGGESLRGWQAALEGEEDGLSCLSVCHTIIHPHISHIHTITLVVLISPGIMGVYLWNVRKHRCLLSRPLVRCLPTELLLHKIAPSIGRTEHLRTVNWTNLFQIHIFDSKLGLFMLSPRLEYALCNEIRFCLRPQVQAY